MLIRHMSNVGLWHELPLDHPPGKRLNYLMGADSSLRSEPVN